MDKKHTLFTKWAKTRGAQLNGIKPAQIPGKGLGIIATRNIEEGEEVAFIPTNLLLTTDCIPRSFIRKLGSISVHGLLAAFLNFGSEQLEHLQPWIATWPTVADFAECMPVMMTQALHHKGTKSSFAFFPHSIIDPEQDRDSRDVDLERDSASLLAKQEGKLQRDWETVLKAFPKVDFEVYRYYWLVVNTRCFYYDMPLHMEPRDHEDKMILCPWLDYLNHAEEGCHVSFNETGFSVVANRLYVKGEEVVTSYGKHSNDTLWTEYGFVLEKNKWDSVNLDQFVLSPTTGIGELYVKRRLKEFNFLGNYYLSTDGSCWRTDVAIRTQTLRLPNWQRFVSGERLLVDEEKAQRKAEQFLGSMVLLPFYEEASRSIHHLDHQDIRKLRVPQNLVDTAFRRWRQIQLLIREAVQNGLSEPLRSEILCSFDEVDTTTSSITTS